MNLHDTCRDAVATALTTGRRSSKGRRCGGVISALLIAVVSGAAHAEPTGYPLEITHALGTVTLEEKPERIATVGWANHEVPLALGVVPVGFAAANFGDDDGNGLLPWVEERLAELDASPPALFDETNGVDVDAVAASDPDVILAAYSGLGEADYAALSEIAPVVAYPGSPWTTSWRDTIRLDSAGMGRPEAGAALIARLDARITQAVAAHPELAQKTVMLVTRLDPSKGGKIGFYTDNDPRVALFHELGLVSPSFVQAASTSGRVAGEIGAERLDALADVDILVTYADRSQIESWSSDPRTAFLPAIENDAIVSLGNTPLGTAANPTPLSIPWGLEDYVERLAAAARR